MIRSPHACVIVPPFCVILFRSIAKQPQQYQTLKCVFCQQEKPLDAFSKSQLNKVLPNEFAPWVDPSKKNISCKKCTAGSNTSLKCMLCGITKPLDQFAKNQRREAEKARCLKCMKKRAEEDPWATEPDSDDDDDDDY
ncbi:Stc1 domain-containing protein [Mycotypha africana]|uniref:Stc1 domain-containing protein n=1 Tax=Mycotypha africana TaxID=64632 RepID=UPI0023012C56|nr:Stc1 domain-containing protein [Mycotypha africana]KAI8977421.1 Stc1 domain-containing protein [Mycotypha africana]